MSKNDINAILIAVACNHWLEQAKPHGESAKYHNVIKNKIDTFLKDSEARLKRIPSHMTRLAISKALEKKFNKICKFEKRMLKDGELWLPLMLVNEVLGIFFEDKKHYKAFYEHKYYDLYEFVTPEQQKASNIMGDKALSIVNFVNRGCK